MSEKRRHQDIWLPVFGIGGAVIICFLGLYLNRVFYHDDAFITLRYAYNFIHGHGLVWNINEPVEGYTNFLYLLIISALGFLGIDLVLASRIVNLTAFFILIFFTAHQLFFVSKTKAQETRVSLLPFMLILTPFPLFVWIWGGLEGPLFTLFCTMAIWLFSANVMDQGSKKHILTCGLIFALACLTRPDGILFVWVSVLFLLRGSGRGLRSTALFLCSFSLVYLPYLLWKYLYYGDIFPNTFYAKVTAFNVWKLERGFKYIFSYSITPPFIFLLLYLAVPWAIYHRTLNRKVVYILSCLCLYLFYVVFIGGDPMPAYRLIVPLIPSAVLALYLLTKDHIIKFKPSSLSLCYGLVLCLMSGQLFHPGVNQRRMITAAFIGEIVGEFINMTWPENTLIALNTAGSTPYFALNYRYIDMLGLNDALIARREIQNYRLPWQKIAGHAKGDGNYVLARKPDYIIVGPVQGTTIDDPWFLSDLEMSENPEFSAQYIMYQVQLDVRDKTGYELYDLTRTGMLTFTYYQNINQTGAQDAAG
ncbi:hypothetical protein ACFL27_28030 [candidate division CSSED10-310 bacterium]|uniref:Glycosyltransferase RgtA/B/C/D-like domain-containing protein n=1 Tax=candidate division CSSED10-310 bacterium TaxID=2855610 RepID=A0ABV6Z6I3_UNCC1